MTTSEFDSEKRRKACEVVRFEDGQLKEVDDFVAAEEPLEIRVVFGPAGKRKDRSLSITMRTPGHDRELAAGFLVGEGIVSEPRQIVDFEETGQRDAESGETNQLCVHLAEDVEFDFAALQRNFYMTSSCGICGTASLEAVRARVSNPLGDDSLQVDATLITSLPASLRKVQETFEETGGLHAAGMFDLEGTLVVCREDVGRHNALDKLIGRRFLDSKLPDSKSVVLVSGRASFELVQKAILAGIPMLVAVGAPSSLAAQLASEFGLTLVGFASRNRFNIYSHSKRISNETL